MTSERNYLCTKRYKDEKTKIEKHSGGYDL